MQYSQHMTLGRSINGRIILGKLTPADRTYGNTRKNIQRSATLASGRVVSDYITTNQNIDINFKNLGFNRWLLKDTQELMSIPFDGSEINLVDWTLGSVTIPTNTSYYYTGYVGDELALYVTGAATNYVEDSGFENPVVWDQVFAEQFSRYSYDGSNSSLILNAAPSFSAYMVILPAPLVESYDLQDIESYAAPQFPYGTNSLFLDNTTWITPVDARTMPQTQGTVEFWYQPQSWVADSSIRNIFFTIDSNSFSQILVNYDGFSFKALMFDTSNNLDLWSTAASIVPNSYMHFAVTYNLSYGITGFFVNGVPGAETRPVSWVASTVFGKEIGNKTVYTSFGLNGGNFLPSPTLTATGLYSNFRITYNQLYLQSFTPPTVELDLVDQLGFPVVFKNTTSWQQQQHVPGLGWIMYPTTLDGLQRYSYLANSDMGLILQTSGNLLSLVNGNSYWQDISYNMSWRDISNNSTVDLVRMSVHQQQYNYGGAFQFNGTTAFVNIANSGTPYSQYQIATPLTLCVWARVPNSFIGVGTLVGSNSLIGSGQIYYDVNITSFSSQLYLVGVYNNGSVLTSGSYAIPMDEKWHHYAMVMSGTNMYTYVDGVQVTSPALSSPFPAPNGSFNIGRMPYGDGGTGGNYFNGYIADVQFYDTVLSLSQINQIFSNGGSITAGGLQGWWKLNDQTSPKVVDSSILSNNGTSSFTNIMIDAPYAASKIHLDVSYATASFVSNYAGDSSDTLHYWQVNQVRDNDMEAATIHAWDGGNAPVWNVNTVNLTTTKDSRHAHSGTWALRITSGSSFTGTPIFPHQSIATPKVTGDSFYVSLWYYAVSGSFGPKIHTYLQSYDLNPSGTTLGQWVQLTSIIPDDTSNYFRLDFEVTPNTDVWIDDIELRDIPVRSGVVEDRNWFPDGYQSDRSYAIYGPPYTFPISPQVVVSYPAAFGYMYMTNLSAVTVNFIENIYTLKPGVLSGNFDIYTFSYNGTLNGALTCYPSGNSVSFSCSLGTNAVKGLSFGPLSYLTTDTYATLQYSLPSVVGGNEIASVSPVMSYQSDNGSYGASIVTSGTSYTAILANGITNESWTWTSLSQHLGNIALEGIGSWSTSWVTVSQLSNPSWVLALPVGPLESVTGIYTNGGGSIALDPNTKFTGKYSLNLSARANVSFSVYQSFPSLPVTLKGMAFETQSIGAGSWEVHTYTNSPQVDLGYVVFTGVVNPWSYSSVNMISGNPGDMQIQHLGGIGSAWFDNMQLSKTTGAPYADTTETITPISVSPSFNASYLRTDQGTFTFFVNPQSFTGDSNGQWMLFTVYNTAVDYFKVYFETRNYGALNKIDVTDSKNGLVVQGSTTINANTWIHVAIAWDQTGCKIYINGAFLAGSSVVPHIPSAGNLTIGWTPDDVSQYILWAYALFEKFYVMDRALSASEVFRVRDSADIEGLCLVELIGLAESGTGTIVHTYVDLRNNSYSFDTLMGDMPVTNISGDLRHADVAIKLLQKDVI